MFELSDSNTRITKNCSVINATYIPLIAFQNVSFIIDCEIIDNFNETNFFLKHNIWKFSLILIGCVINIIGCVKKSLPLGSYLILKI